jgi:hypothetical protein
MSFQTSAAVCLMLLPEGDARCNAPPMKCPSEAYKRE